MKWFTFDRGVSSQDILKALDLEMKLNEPGKGGEVLMLCTLEEFTAIQVALNANFSDKGFKKLMPFFTKRGDAIYCKDLSFPDGMLHLLSYLGQITIAHTGALKAFSFYTPTQAVKVTVGMYESLDSSKSLPRGCYYGVFLNDEIQFFFPDAARAEHLAFELYDRTLRVMMLQGVEKMAPLSKATR